MKLDFGSGVDMKQKEEIVLLMYLDDLSLYPEEKKRGREREGRGGAPSLETMQMHSAKVELIVGKAALSISLRPLPSLLPPNAHTDTVFLYFSPQPIM